MNINRRLFLGSLVLGLFLTNINATELNSDSVKVENKPLISNVEARFMLRSEVRGNFEGDETDVNFINKPAMVSLGFDMGSKFAFYSRYRFDFPTTIQSDGTPVSLLAFNVQYKPMENLKFVVGKQVMLQGSWEFEYNPIDIFYYSLMGNHIQGFVTGGAAHYTVGKQHMALQVSKVVDSDYTWNGSKNAWNATLYYAGNIGNEFYKPIWSYTYTYAGNNKSLHNFMIGNQFNINRLKLECDLMAQNSFRHYRSENESAADIQRKTSEYSIVGFAEYAFPGDKFLLAGKYAYDKRKDAESNDVITKEQTISMQLRYKLSQKYGLTLHGAAAYRISDTPEKYQYSFSDIDKKMFNIGITWDFKYKHN